MASNDQELALHTDVVVVGGKQAEKEATYKGYTRVPAGDGHHFFPEAKESGQRLTHYSVGKNGTITEVGELSPHTLTQDGAGPVIHLSAAE